MRLYYLSFIRDKHTHVKRVSLSVVFVVSVPAVTTAPSALQPPQPAVTPAATTAPSALQPPQPAAASAATTASARTIKEDAKGTYPYVIRTWLTYIFHILVFLFGNCCFSREQISGIAAFVRVRIRKQEPQQSRTNVKYKSFYGRLWISHSCGAHVALDTGSTRRPRAPCSGGHDAGASLASSFEKVATQTRVDQNERFVCGQSNAIFLFSIGQQEALTAMYWPLV